jgi:hypothetical protein
MNSNQLLILIIVAFVFIIYMRSTDKESWINYKEEPLGNYTTGENNPHGLSFYKRERFRKPYMWPACHMVDYPVPHCKHFD